MKLYELAQNYSEEVHETIEFLIKENKKIQQERDNLSKQLL